MAAAPDVQAWRIRVPASTANLGPGFDVLGLGLALPMVMDVTVPAPSPGVTITYTGDGAETISKDPATNLITRVAAALVARHGRRLPPSYALAITNRIPMSRGLGSSGTAVVAGVLLGNTLGDLGLTPAQLLDFAVLIEGHPDNVAASYRGGFVASYLRWAIPAFDRIEDLATLDYPSEPLATVMPLPWSEDVAVVAVVPDFELETEKARAALPAQYAKRDVVANLQRLTVMTHALGQRPVDATTVSESMRDCLHQPYRQALVPGMAEILALTPQTCPGLLGVCMSGAGPTMLALRELQGFVVHGRCRCRCRCVGGVGDGRGSRVGVPAATDPYVCAARADPGVCGV
ncbi:hypothetical protein CXG81DRAFT_29263 [Caulochytrium protostelioides]|uniref:Homoserine kinase n=1 Tax=Caulochytrium protostelioides TaxID=1555241 RepID=A0A4P9XDC8_9FUNG|nr:hypothetical protein CXG81DRAFT_29263 [Caulochytrium protostelioides]|eukprot:RKP03507.1 hypothetical protein CXG81DRAFT_29263 [Caulochytrium protostelioides]